MFENPGADGFRRALPLLAVVMGLLFVVLFTHFIIIDDAYITFRHSVNLANHGQLVFNLGERVEGMTNLLWALILAGVALLGMPVEGASVWLSLGCMLYAGIRLVQLGVVLGTTPWAGVIAALVLILNPSFVGSATSGMEGGLFSALLVEAVYQFACSHPRRALIAASLAFLTRPEAVVFAGLLLCFVLFESKSFRKGLPYVLYVAIPALGVTAFRWLYYDSLVPNTVIAKSFGLSKLQWFLEPMMAYFRGFFVSAPYLAIIALAAAFWVLRDGRRDGKSSRVALLSLGTLLFSYVVVIRNAGDWMPHYRLLSQYGVLYSVLLVVLLRQQVVGPAVATALLIYPCVQTVWRAVELKKTPSISIMSSTNGGFWEDVTNRLMPVLKEGDRVSADVVGCISYRMPSILFHDPAGLADAYVARHGQPSIHYGKHDSTYTVGTVRPTVLVWHASGHLRGVPQEMLDQYVTLSPEPPDGWGTDVVMIRNDCFDRIGPAFPGWHRVKLDTEKDSLGPYEAHGRKK